MFHPFDFSSPSASAAAGQAQFKSANGLGYRTGWHYDVDGDGTVEANTAGNSDDPWFHWVYDARWRKVATYRTLHYHASGGWTVDGDPKEQFVYHAAGLAGAGGSSYIDSVILRDRDANTAWEDQADGTLEERVYLCQNWRADVVALMTSGGHLINQVRYDPYGVPFGIAKTDLDGDGDVDGDDATRFSTLHSGGTHPYADWNFDGAVDLSDQSAYTSDKNADTGLGRGDPGYDWGETGGALRKAYAGYEIDPVLTGSEGWESVYHVRHRVYMSRLGRWTRRDPLGYVDGMSLSASLRQSPMMYHDSLGLACTVVFSCTLSSSEKVSECCRQCVYHCRETDRWDSAGGTIGCEDVPRGQDHIKTVQRCNFWCIIGIPKCGAPGESKCPPNHESKISYSDWGDLPGRDCNVDDCVANCNAVEDVGMKACGRLKGKQKYVCERGVRLAGWACRDFCNAWCQGQGLRGERRGSKEGVGSSCGDACGRASAEVMRGGIGEEPPGDGCGPPGETGGIGLF